MNPDAAVVALFDVDGVLITPGGYRRASEDAMNVFLKQLGQPHWKPDSTVYEHFESYMITSEWDMMPFLLCTFLEHALLLFKPEQTWNSYAQAAHEIQQHPDLPKPANTLAAIDKIGKIINGQSGTPATWVYEARQSENFPFPNLTHHGVLEELLTNTRSIQHSFTMQTFQEHIIGSQLFQEYYHLEPRHNVINYLTAYDICPVKVETHEQLRQRSNAGELFLSIYTARPSMPPIGIPSNGDGAYSPEAEQAMELIPWEKSYLSAYGKVYWLSQQCAFHSEDLLKPSPVQALSAIAYHFIQDEIQALLWAQSLYRAYLDGKTENLIGKINLPEQIQLHVFEDSPNGLRGGVLAGEILQTIGVNVSVNLWGISDNPIKQTALQAQGGRVFTDVNEAIREALF